MNPSSRQVPLTTADPLGGRWELCKPVCLLDPMKEGDAYIPKEEQRKSTEGRILPGSGLLLAIIEK